MLPVANVPSRVIDERFPAVKIKARPVLRGVYREPLKDCQCGCDPYDGRLLRSPVYPVRDNLLGQSQRAVAQCNPCDCNVYGAATRQCNRETGQFICNRGIGGYKCDQCARGYLGDAPYLLRQLGDHTGQTAGGNEPNDRESEDDQDAATGAYKKEFDSMSKKIEVIQGLLMNTISDREIEAINANIADVNLSESAKAVEASEKQLQETSNTEGTLNPTRDAWNRVTQLGETTMAIQELNDNAERQCKRTSRMMIKSANHVVTNLTDIIDNNTATPEKIRELAEQIQQYTLQLQPDQIQTLTEQIDEAVSHLESIIRNTKHDLDRVEQQNCAPSRMGLGRAGVGGFLFIAVPRRFDKETDDAYNRANVTAGKVDELKTRLNKLHVSNVQNQQDAEKIIKQAETVKESANKAHVLRLGISLQLKELHKTYESNQKDLDLFESKIQGLTEQINTHLNKIQPTPTGTASARRETSNSRKEIKRNSTQALMTKIYRNSKNGNAALLRIPEMTNHSFHLSS
ncbi:laminin beta-2 chain [Culex quinquefasciatus]|uniref:Laminin beta-2 chain n=1 Tax=Culex quinquefasciatus TaxID=7176 RepID=B0X7B4_CULQU|nr:laminin beta-2 chain [Culex quinquefasciatus]|eukprot:XP_001865536.1 laminin beta-2 chain [Culex quinquefasciatus]